MSKAIFHQSAGTKNAGMYHQNAQKFIKGAKSKGMTVKAEGEELIAYPKKVVKRNIISTDGKALVPKAGLQQLRSNRALKKQTDTAFVKQADKKLKGFKFGVGVGP